MCLATGISWDLYWTLTGDELAALTEAARDVARSRNRRR